MNYKVISTGSKGNALHIEEGSLSILVDCGVPFLSVCDIKPDLILLTHEHGDHLNMRTLKRILQNHPTTKVLTPPHLLNRLFEAGIPVRQIYMCMRDDTLKFKKIAVEAKFSTLPLFHDVENVGWRIDLTKGVNKVSVMYATDTARMDHIRLPGLDYYFIEANYEDDEIEQRIAEKEAAGEYIYEFRARANHLSLAQADAWLAENAAIDSKIIYLHQHGGCCE